MASKPRWRLDHDPFARPLGCNGKYGVSGVQRHAADGTETCKFCRETYNHYKREQRRGGIKPRTPKPCGTYAAVDRHQRRGEPLDFACRVARARYQAKMRERLEREAVGNVHAEGKRLAEWIATRRRRRCGRAGTHTIGHCEKCGVHRTPRRRAKEPAMNEQTDHA